MPSSSKVVTTEASPGSDRSVAVTVFVLLAVASFLPVLLTPIPAMVDYPNHLARMYLLSQDGTPGANPYYDVTWAFYPNLAMDVIVPLLAKLIGVQDATRCFLLVSQVLIVGGAAFLEYVVKGRVQLAGFAALAFLYCLPFSWGFINFQFGLGVALWAIACYLRLIERSVSARFAVNAIFVAILFVAHFYALGIYGVTIGITELWRAWDRKLRYRDIAVRLVVLAVPVLVLLVVMKAASGSIGSAGNEWHFAFKPIWLFRIMNGYNLVVSAITAFVLIAALYYAASRKVLRIEPAGVWIGIGFAILYLAIPSKLLGTSFADLRIIPAAALILPAFCSLALPNRRWTRAALVVIGGVTLANLAVVYAVWLPYRADFAAIVQSFSKLDRGAMVLIGTSGEGDDPPFNDLTQYPMFYAPTLAVHNAAAFVPNLFTDKGKQPVRAAAAVGRLAIPYGGPVPMRLLGAIAAGLTPPDTPDFIRTWPRDFGYLYVLGPRVANPLPDLLEELDGSRRFVLYRIRRTP